MPEQKPGDQLSERDRLLSRPEHEQLPTKLDPSAPHARNLTPDPQTRPKEGQGSDPKAADIGRSA